MWKSRARYPRPQSLFNIKTFNVNIKIGRAWGRTELGTHIVILQISCVIDTVRLPVLQSAYPICSTRESKAPQPVIEETCDDYF